MNLKSKLLITSLIVGGMALSSIAIAQSVKDSDEKKKSEKIEITIVDGDTKVEITTIEDGKETTKVLTGEEAEKYMEENHGGSGSMSINITDADDEFSIDIMMKEMEEELQKHMGDVEFDFEDELAEALKDVEIDLEHVFKDVEIDLEEAMKDLDKSRIQISIATSELGEELEELLKELDFDIEIDTTDGKNKVIRKKIIIEDGDKKIEEKKQNGGTKK